MRGKVIAMVGGVYKVQTDSAHCHSVKPLGVLKHRKIQIVVGDDAEIDLSDSTLTDIYPRKNLLIRPRIANIDLGIVVISADKPQFSSYLLDKFLTLLNFSGIRPLVVLSKSDLTDEKTIGRIVGQYRKMEIEVLPYSRSDEAAFAEILRRIKGKTAAFMGQSGVGKSSLINRGVFAIAGTGKASDQRSRFASVPERIHRRYAGVFLVGTALLQRGSGALFSLRRSVLSFVPVRRLPASERAGL